MNRLMLTLTSAATLALMGGCAHQPRLDAKWYLTEETPGTPIAIWLVNRGRAAGEVLEVYLNKPEGFLLAPMTGRLPAHLDTGQTLVLSAGRSARDPRALAQDKTRPLPALRGCLPVRLFVKTRYGQQRLQRVEINHPLPSAYAPEALLSCP